MSGRNSAPGRSVTSKALTILEAFTGQRTELSMSDIARITELPTSTVHRLLQDLVEWGGLERSASGNYFVGVRLWEVAARSTRTYGLRQAALPILQGLWETTHAHVLLAVLDGSEALIVERISGTVDVPSAGRAGGRLPLHASAVGKVLLAESDPAFQQHVLDGSLASYTQDTITDPRALRAELAAVRKAGVATSIEELTLGSESCAAVVKGPADIGLAAVSILGKSGVRAQREMQMLAKSAARAITHLLANNPAEPISPYLPVIAPRR